MITGASIKTNHSNVEEASRDATLLLAFGYLGLLLSTATHTKASPPWLVQSNAVVLSKGASLELVSCGARPFPLAAVLACATVQWSGVGHTDCKSLEHAHKGDWKSTPNTFFGYLARSSVHCLVPTTYIACNRPATDPAAHTVNVPTTYRTRGSTGMWARPDEHP